MFNRKPQIKSESYSWNVESEFEYINTETSESRLFSYDNKFSNPEKAEYFADGIILGRHAIELAEGGIAVQEFYFNELPKPWVEVSKSVSIVRQTISE